jgi:NADPH-dependent stearoyl-CoA 9-desaturase
MNTSHNTSPTAAMPYLNDEQAESFGRELDAIRERILASRGARDAAYIRRLIRTQRGLEVGSRALIYTGILAPPAFVLGAVGLGVAKILENMEIGHNVMHGQWDWMRDPKIHSSTWEWDNTCPADQWKRTHNHEHHTWTNVLGKDRDVGYGILRMSEQQKWQPFFLLNPINNALLALFFQWGVALHDSEMDQLRKTGTLKPESRAKLKGMWRKARKQVLKDYVLFPALAGPFFLPVLASNVAANLIRNLWSYMIIFCGHFPDGVHQFTEAQVQNETRGRWYLRQLLGSANIQGGPLMHVMSGNLSFQIEHHLFPDLPSNRYAEIAPQVQALCQRYGLPYNSAPLYRQFGTTLRKVFRLALPTRGEAALA